MAVLSDGMHEWSKEEVFVRNRADTIQHNDAFALRARQAETTPSTRPNPSLHMFIIQPAVDLVEAAARRPGLSTTDAQKAPNSTSSPHRQKTTLVSPLSPQGSKFLSTSVLW